MFRPLLSTPLRHATAAHLRTVHPNPQIISQSTRAFTLPKDRPTQSDKKTPSPSGTTRASPQDDDPNRRSVETDPIPTPRDARERARQLAEIEVPGLMPELQDAILRHPGVEATMVVRVEKIPRELDVGDETQHASGFVPPTPGMPREPEKCSV